MVRQLSVAGPDRRRRRGLAPAHRSPQHHQSRDAPARGVNLADEPAVSRGLGGGVRFAGAGVAGLAQRHWLITSAPNAASVCGGAKSQNHV